MDKLFQDFSDEMLRHGKYEDAIMQNAARTIEFKALMEERRNRYGDAPITEEEKAYLEKNVGLERAMRLADIISNKWGPYSREYNKNNCPLQVLALVKHVQAQTAWLQREFGNV